MRKEERRPEKPTPTPNADEIRIRLDTPSLNWLSEALILRWKKRRGYTVGGSGRHVEARCRPDFKRAGVHHPAVPPSATWKKSCFLGATGGDEEWNPRWGVPDCRDHVANQDALLALCIRLAGTLSTISQHRESRRTLSIQAPRPVLTVNTTGMGGGGWEGTRHHTPGAAGPFNHNRFRSVLVVSLRGGEAEYLQILPSSFSYIRGREENPLFAETAHSVCCNG